jgi:nitrite reductase/ring-hydroxylating ferredoxin subunit
MQKQETQRWIAIAKVGDVAPSDVRRCQVKDRCIALFNLQGRLYATDDICTHAHAHLSDGYVDGETVECPLHQGLFHIPTGKAMAPPVTENLATYPVRIEGEDVLVGFADTDDAD